MGVIISMDIYSFLRNFSRNVHYINRSAQEQYMTMRDYPPELDKKMKLLTYFRKYMTEHLMKAGKVCF